MGPPPPAPLRGVGGGRPGVAFRDDRVLGTDGADGIGVVGGAVVEHAEPDVDPGRSQESVSGAGVPVAGLDVALIWSKASLTRSAPGPNPIRDGEGGARLELGLGERKPVLVLVAEVPPLEVDGLGRGVDECDGLGRGASELTVAATIRTGSRRGWTVPPSMSLVIFDLLTDPAPAADRGSPLVAGHQRRAVGWSPRPRTGVIARSGPSTVGPCCVRSALAGHCPSRQRVIRRCGGGTGC
ncbi:hypothetical protein P3T39_005632 [Kitasatospora sp. GP82]|nr:hypothetical protein [Kitasatospora sp. GP82]